jgi:hypothetical protein
MKKSQRGKGAKTSKSAASNRKPAVRNLDPRKADQVKAGRVWTKGGGASVG